MYVTDTHPLIWYSTGKSSSLPSKVLSVFQQAEASETLIYIPAVVFWEIAMLENLGKIKLQARFDRWANTLLLQNGFEIIPLDISLISKSADFEFTKDPFDKLIVACSAVFEVPLITKDTAIIESNAVEIFW